MEVKNIMVDVVDNARSTQSQQLVHEIDASKYFNNLKEKYGLKKDCSTSVDVMINSEGHFELILEFSDEERLLVITNSIVIDME